MQLNCKHVSILNRVPISDQSLPDSRICSSTNNDSLSRYPDSPVGQRFPYKTAMKIKRRVLVLNRSVDVYSLENQSTNSIERSVFLRWADNMEWPSTRKVFSSTYMSTTKTGISDENGSNSFGIRSI
jgi:hypothetical protein